MFKKQFSCKRRRKKMAITKELPRSHHINANFKSKLALVLGARDINGKPSQHGSTISDIKRGDYRKLEHILETRKLPLTATLKRFNGEGLNRENGLCTIQCLQTMTKLQCVCPQSEEISVPASDSKLSVKFLSIDNTAMYSTISQVRAKRKEHNITWFTSTKEFCTNNTTFGVGQIFTFAPSTILSSFKRDRNIRGVHVCQYPTNKKLLLPLDTEGNFKKCDSPTTYQTCELAELAKTDNFPYFIVFHSADTPLNFQKYNETHLFVKEKQSVNIVFVSRQIRGSLQIHSFPMHEDLYAKISAKNKPIDTLDETELRMVKHSFEADAGIGKGETYRVKTYNELGIIRLLEEIFVELNQIGSVQVAGAKDDDKIYSKLITNNNSCRQNNKNKGDPSDSYENRVIKTFLRNSDSGNKRLSEARYLKSTEGDDTKTIDYNYVTQHSCNIYVNEQTSSEESDCCSSDEDVFKTRRELVVEFDDGGYVIIPFSGKSPKISVETDQVQYKSRDNIAYNYKEKQRHHHTNNRLTTPATNCDDGDEPVYQYISSDELERSSHRRTFPPSKIKEQVTIRQNLTSRQESNQHEFRDSVLDRYSTAYDYPHLGHFTIPSGLSRRYIKELSADEITDMLKSNLLKHHIDVFNKYSVNGEKLSVMHEKEFLDLNFTKFEARKLNCFIDGWRPRIDGDTKSWLSKLVKDWNVDDVSKYLLHINMHSLQAFALRHKIDGFLLTQMVADDMLDSLTRQHSLVLRATDIQRLRNYILEDDKPKFKFFQ